MDPFSPPEPTDPARRNAWVADAIRRVRADGPTDRQVEPLRPLPLPALEGVEIWAKDESVLPTGSLKYRLVQAMYAHALASGRIGPGTEVFTATGGAVAVAAARFACLLDLPFTAVVPTRSGSGVPAEWAARIESAGGRCRAAQGPAAAVQQEAGELAAASGGHLLDHFADADLATSAWEGRTLADELFDPPPDAAHPAPTWLVAGLGTGATTAALGRYLRRNGHPTQLAAVDAENSAYFPAWASGCRAYATGMPSRIPGLGRPRTEPGFLPEVLDLVIPVPDAASLAATRWLHAVGFEVGPAAGAVLWGACHLAARMGAAGERGTLVGVFGDGAEPYRRTQLDPAWVRERGLDPAPYEADLDNFVRTGAWRSGTGER